MSAKDDIVNKLREDALKALQECEELDPECAHATADVVLCELLIALGYADVVEAYDKLEKWYA